MGKYRRLCAKRLEDLDLDRRIRNVVLAANDMGDAGVGIVGDAREGVERRAVFADEHRIGDGRRVDLLRTPDQVVPGRWPLLQEEAPMRLAALCFKLALFLFRQ